jgi:gas vesicle protein
MKKTLSVIAIAAAGYVAGVLFAPKSGKETREDLKKKADEAKKVASQKAEKAKVVYDENSVKVKQAATEIGSDAKDFAQKAKASVSRISKTTSQEYAHLEREAKKTLKSAADITQTVSHSVQRGVNKLR